MSRSNYIWTPEKVQIIYNDWFESEDPDVVVAERYGISVSHMRLMFRSNGLYTKDVKTRKCEVCGEAFQANSTKRKYCSDACYKKANREKQKERKYVEAKELETSIKERFPGYSKIAAICVAAKAEGLSYGQYVGKYGV